MASRSERPWKTWYSHRRWRRLRLIQLAKEPLCCDCLERGVVKAANEVDHITPHKGDRAAFWAGPFASRCKECHSQKTAREEGKKIRPYVAVDGTPQGW